MPDWHVGGKQHCKQHWHCQWRVGGGGGNWANAQSKFKTALLKIRLNTTNY